MSNQTETAVHDQEPIKKNHWAKMGFFISTIAVIIFICAFGYGYFQLTQATISLAHTVEDLQNQMINIQNNVGTLQQSIEELRQTTQKNQQPLAQQDQMTTELYSRLNALDNQIDQLPLLVPERERSTNLSQETPNTEQKELSWWQKGLERSWQALRKIVIVRNISQGSLPLIAPEEKAFLYQNVHAQIQGAMWAVLHHNPEVYQTSLARASAWIQRYFVQESPQTINVLRELQELQKVNISTTAQ